MREEAFCARDAIPRAATRCVAHDKTSRFTSTEPTCVSANLTGTPYGGTKRSGRASAALTASGADAAAIACATVSCVVSAWRPARRNAAQCASTASIASTCAEWCDVVVCRLGLAVG